MYEQNFNPYSANLAVVKDYFKSGKVLALGILYVLSAVTSVVVTLMSTSFTKAYLSEFINYFLTESGLGYSDYTAITSAMNTSSASTVASAISSVAVVILMAVAFFLIYAKSRSQNPQSSPKAGVTILYVLAMIAFVMTIVAVSLLWIMLIIVSILTFASSESIWGNQAMGVNIIMIVFLVIMLIGTIYWIICATATKNFYGSVRKSLSSVELQNKGANAFGVTRIILAVGICLSALGTIAFYSAGSALVNRLVQMGSLGQFGDFYMAPPTSLIAAMSVAYLISIMICIFEAALAFGYKKHIDNMKYGYNGTPYGGDNINTPADNAQNPYANTVYNDSFSAPVAPVYPEQSPYEPAATAQPYENAADTAEPATSEPVTVEQPEQQSVEPQYSAPEQSARPKFCPQCGSGVDGSFPFCPNCGKKL